MKIYDKVKVVKIKDSYKEENIKLGDIGKICIAEIRDNNFYVRFETGDDVNIYKYDFKDSWIFEHSETEQNKTIEIGPGQ